MTPQQPAPHITLQSGTKDAPGPWQLATWEEVVAKEKAEQREILNASVEVE